MKKTLFEEFQYYIKRVNNARKLGILENGDTLDDLEERFRLQVQNGLVMTDPDSQELAMEILLSDISEDEKREYLLELRKTGQTSFVIKKVNVSKPNESGNKQNDMDHALDLIMNALKTAGLRVQRQPLGVKMLQAAHDLGDYSYTDPGDLKLLFVNTIKLSGHVKKADPFELAKIFNTLV